MSVYVVGVKGTDKVKIGYSSNVTKRLSGLATSVPGTLEVLRIIPGDITMEREFHHRFSKSRLLREWFSFDPEMMTFSPAPETGQPKTESTEFFLSDFTDEQSRICANLRQQYDAWVDLVRQSRDLPYGINWKTISKAEYLYRFTARNGSGTSLGRRNADTERLYAEYLEEKSRIQTMIQGTQKTLRETCAIYMSLSLPMIASEAAGVLREADLRGILGSQIQLVGTNALAAYSVEAQRSLQNHVITDEFNLTWIDDSEDDGKAPIMSMLKAVDSTFTVNTERGFQARNKKAYEVEILVAPRLLKSIRRHDRLRPVPLEEQDWLLRGKQVTNIILGRDGSPAKIVAPDPRWFALQKLWMSRQEKRNPDKRPKDLKQGMALLELVNEHMPQYPMDEAFEAELPEELAPIWLEWKTEHRRETKPNWFV